MDTADLEQESAFYNLRLALRSKRLRSLFQVLLVLVICFAGVAALKSPRTLPFEKIQVLGEIKWLDKEQLNQAILSHIDGGFFSLDVSELNKAVNAIPWVAQASVRRVWPATLQVLVREHQPVATWNNKMLINAKGHLFAPVAVTSADLVDMRGPEGSHDNLLEIYLQIQQLLAEQDLQIVAVKMNERRALDFTLASGARILLGRVRDSRDSVQQLRRFVTAYQASLRAKMQYVQLVDLRYTNGLSVRWLDEPISVGHVPLHKKNKG